MKNLLVFLLLTLPNILWAQKPDPNSSSILRSTSCKDDMEKLCSSVENIADMILCLESKKNISMACDGFLKNRREREKVMAPCKSAIQRSCSHLVQKGVMNLAALPLCLNTPGNDLSLDCKAAIKKQQEVLTIVLPSAASSRFTEAEKSNTNGPSPKGSPLPKGGIVFFNSESCPEGFKVYEPLRWRNFNLTASFESLLPCIKE